MVGQETLCSCHLCHMCCQLPATSKAKIPLRTSHMVGVNHIALHNVGHDKPNTTNDACTVQLPEITTNEPISMQPSVLYCWKSAKENFG